jgi:galactokinase
VTATHPFGVALGAEPAWIARAPGRLDLMGGIADYCGSLVLEFPLGLSAWVALQPLKEPVIEVRHAAAPAQFRGAITFNLSALIDPDGEPNPASRLKSMLARDPSSAWAGYLIGVFQMLLIKGWIKAPKSGARLLLSSEVPWGSGVASSAALEVAALQAMAAAWGLEKSPVEMALLAQAAENEVMGAPCGVMDQATALMGRKGHLLKLLCRPCEPKGQLALPDGVGVFGINSGVKHSVGGSAYASVRAAARMGEALLRGALGEGEIFLAGLSLADYESRLRRTLPAGMNGKEFLKSYGPLADPVVALDAKSEYRVRACVDHHVREGARVGRFAAFLEEAGRPGLAAASRLSSLKSAGALMDESNQSYSENCLLGCAETELIVEKARKLGPERGVYGAKISGGGAGGTVVILAEKSAEGDLRALARDYASLSRHQADFFAGSSEGALATPPEYLGTPA